MIRLVLALSIMSVALFAVGMSIYGLILAFSASILLGIVTLILEPLPLVFGLAQFFFDKNIPEYIMQWLNS